MCRLERKTDNRTAPWLAMRARVWRGRRRRWFFFVCLFSSSLLLRFLDHHALIGVADPLALVGLGRADGANFGSQLANHLPVSALDHDFGLRRTGHGDAGRHLLDHRMREPDLQVELAALRSEEHTSEL